MFIIMKNTSEQPNGISYRLPRIVEWQGAFVTTYYDIPYMTLTI